MKQLIRLYMLIGISVLMACGGSQPGGPETGPDAVPVTTKRLKDIAGTEWHLKSMKMENESVTLIEDTKITFACDENGEVAGIASINRYFGSFNLKGDGEIIWSKAFGMTRMAGPPAVMDQETRFMQALPLTSHLYLIKDLLVLTSSDQSVLLEFERN